jgi:hypothetical protein
LKNVEEKKNCACKNTAPTVPPYYQQPLKYVDQLAETFRRWLVPESILTVEGGEGVGVGERSNYCE